MPEGDTPRLNPAYLSNWETQYRNDLELTRGIRASIKTRTGEPYAGQACRGLAAALPDADSIPAACK